MELRPFVGILLLLFLSPVPKTALSQPALQQPATLTPPAFTGPTAAPATQQPEVKRVPLSRRGRFIIDCDTSPETMTQTTAAVRDWFQRHCQGDRRLIGVFDPERGLLTSLGGRLTRPSGANVPSVISLFLREGRGLFGVDRPGAQLRLDPRTTPAVTPQRILKYLQVHNGIPVEGNSVSIRLDDQGVVRSAASSFDPSIYGQRVASRASITPKKVREIIAKDLKLIPPEKLKEKLKDLELNRSLRDKIDRLQPTLVYVSDKNQWKLAFHDYAFAWVPNPSSKEAKDAWSFTATQYLVDALTGQILSKRDAADYCDNSTGQVYTPIDDLLFDESRTHPFNTCEGWKLALDWDGHETAYYLEDHTHDGVLETYDIGGVPAALAAVGYDSVAIPSGWPAETPDDDNDIWRDDIASETATVHWAAQVFRDFLIEEFVRDEIEGGWDIDIGARWDGTTPRGETSFAIGPIHTVIVRLSHTGLAVTAHELMHLVTFWETPGLFPFDDESVNEHISDLFAVFTQYRKSPHPSIRATPWCHHLDTASVDDPTGRFNKLLEAHDAGPDREPEKRILERFRAGFSIPFVNTNSIEGDHLRDYCGSSAPVPRQLCFHKSRERSPVCGPGGRSGEPTTYARAGIPMRAEYLLVEGGNLYRDMRQSHLYVEDAFETNVETNQDSRIFVQPIGMERLMQVSYRTVSERLDREMTYEDWAGRQVSSCWELGYADEDCCNVRNAYVAVGYGESPDEDCDGVLNEVDRCPGFDDRDGEWIENHPVECGREPPPSPGAEIEGCFVGARRETLPTLSANVCHYQMVDSPGGAAIETSLNPYLDYRDIEMGLSIFNCETAPTPCTVSDRGDEKILSCPTTAPCWEGPIPVDVGFQIAATHETRSPDGVRHYRTYSATPDYPGWTVRSIREAVTDERRCPPSSRKRPFERVECTLPASPDERGPIIVGVSDNLGNGTTHSYAEESDFAHAATISPEVGTTLQFSIEAHDPRGRPLSYNMKIAAEAGLHTVAPTTPWQSEPIMLTPIMRGITGRVCYTFMLKNDDGVGHERLWLQVPPDTDDLTTLCYWIDV